MRNGALLVFIGCLALAAAPAAGQEAGGAPVRKGAFDDSATTADLLGAEAAEGLSFLIRPHDDVEWEIFVPETYDPDRPAGLLVYASPFRTGEIPREWMGIMGGLNLIWIGANDSGNDIDANRRIAAALLAAARIERDYAIDRRRVYIAGFSGGGRIASLIAQFFPRAFRGYVYICGVNRWSDDPQGLEEMKANRYVFLTGSSDFNRQETREAFRFYERKGISNIALTIVPHMAHRLPGAEEMEDAIDFLDAEEAGPVE